MAKVNIKYLGGIEDEVQGSSLTGSATLMNAEIYGGIKVLFDYGMFQGGKNEELLNNKTDEEAINADYIVITHAHMDHIGRLPLLIINGFKGKIIMSNLTKQLMLVMLSDYVKLTKDKIESLESGNKRLGLKLKRFLKLIKLDSELRANNLEKKDKLSKQNSLNKLVGQGNLETLLKEAKEVLIKFRVSSESDIEGALNKNIPVLLYDIEDIYRTMERVETLEIGKELDLTDHIVITRENSEVIDKLPAIVRDKGYNRPIYVTFDLKSSLKKRWKEQLKEIFTHSKLNKELREKLKIAFLIKNKEGDFEKYLGENPEKTKKEAIELLEEFNIKFKEDIEKLKEEVEKVPFTLQDIKKAESLLKVVFNNPSEKVVESFKLKFLDAGHIEGSVQAIVTLVTKQVAENITSNHWKKKERRLNGFRNVIKEHQNFLFTGDLGKFTQPNISGTPDIPSYRFDYVQCESTYAAIDHPNKQKEFARFIDEINSAKGKVLIPAFSLQRTQEIILELLGSKLSNKNKVEQLKRLQKEYKKVEKEIQVTENKEKLSNHLLELSTKIEELKSDFFAYSLIVDSPLSQEVQNIFLSNIGEKYKLLDPLVQMRLFGKILIRTLEAGEYKTLYKGDKRALKDIIVSSGGMLQGGAIMNHLKEVISDPNAKIIFTGYQALGTIGQKILSGEKQIIIEGEIYNVRCEVAQIKGYSSHIGASDIETYISELNYSKKAKIILNHGGESREILANVIREINSRVEVIVPSLYDEVNLGL